MSTKSTGSSGDSGDTVKRCPVCGRQYPSEFRFCKDDAAPLTETSGGTSANARHDPASQAENSNRPVAPIAPSGRPVQNGNRLPFPGGKTGWRAAAAILIFGIIVCGGGWMLVSRNSTNAVVPAGEAPSPALPAGIDVTGWKEFAYDGGRFTIHVPPGWSGGEAEKHDDYTRWRFVSPEDPRVTVTADLDTARHGQPAMAVWSDLDARFTRVYKERYTRLGLESGTLDGESAAIWTFRIQKKGEPELTKIDYGVTFGSGDGFALMLAAPPDQIDRWKPVFDQVVRQFTWYGD